jgi:hypothetical protein
MEGQWELAKVEGRTVVRVRGEGVEARLRRMGMEAWQYGQSADPLGREGWWDVSLVGLVRLLRVMDAEEKARVAQWLDVPRVEGWGLGVLLEWASDTDDMVRPELYVAARAHQAGHTKEAWPLFVFGEGAYVRAPMMAVLPLLINGGVGVLHPTN